MQQNDSTRQPRPAGCGCGAYDWRLGFLALLVVAGLVLAGAVALWRAAANGPSPGAARPGASKESCDQTRAGWTAISGRSAPAFALTPCPFHCNDSRCGETDDCASRRIEKLECDWGVGGDSVRR